MSSLALKAFYIKKVIIPGQCSGVLMQTHGDFSLVLCKHVDGSSNLT